MQVTEFARYNADCLSIAESAAADIFLVEDHADTQSILVELLTLRGYTVITADHGQQALDLLERGVRPRLLLLDLMLPRVSGTDLLDVLHSDRKLRGTPIVVITASPRERVNVVADAVFFKPLDYERLLATIQELLTKNR